MLVLLFVTSLVLLGTTAQALPVRAGHVNDFALKLSASRVTALEDFLEAHQADTGHDIVVLVVKNLEGLSVDDYTAQLKIAWNLGAQHVLILIALEDGLLHLSVGDGLKDTYPDTVLEPIKNDMVSLLAQDQFDVAVSRGINQLVGQAAAIAPRGPVDDTGRLQGVWRLALLGGLLVASLLLYVLFLA